MPICKSCLDTLNLLLQQQDAATTATAAPADQVYDNTDLMEKFHISARTLQSWRTKRYIKYSRVGRKIYYHEEDIRQMLANFRKDGKVI